MHHVLVLHSSADTEGSVSRYLAQYFISCCQKELGNHTHFIERDLVANPPPYLTRDYITDINTAKSARTPEQKKTALMSDTMIAELKQSNILVVGCPMYNFSIPSQLKSYCDHVARKGETFRIVDGKRQGLLEGKTAYILLASGDDYAPGAVLESHNFASTYLKTFFHFLGFSKIVTIYCPHLTTSAEEKNMSIQVACEAILLSVKSIKIQGERT